MYFNFIAWPLCLFELSFLKNTTSKRLFVTNLFFYSLFSTIVIYYFYLQNGAILKALSQLQEWVMFDAW